MEIRELDTDIKSGKLKKIYFFYGPEVFLLENKINSIKKHILDEDSLEFGYSKFTGKDSNFEEFEFEFYSYPMSGDKKIIILQNTGWFSNPKSSEFLSLKKFFSEMPEHLYVVIREDNFDKKKEKNIEFIKNSGGGIVNFEHLPIGQLCSWVEKLFSDSGKIVRESDVLYIVNASNFEMSKIYREVEKLIIFSGDDKNIASKDIYSLVTKSGEYKIYELFDDIVDSKGMQALEKLKQILDSKEKPTSVIAGLTNKFSELLTVKLLNSDRVPVSEIVNYLDFKMPEFVVKKMVSQSKKYGEKYLKRIIKLGINIDSSIKTGKIDQKTATEMFVAELIRND